MKTYEKYDKRTENGTKKPSAKPGTIGRWPKGKMITVRPPSKQNRRKIGFLRA